MKLLLLALAASAAPHRSVPGLSVPRVSAPAALGPASVPGLPTATVGITAGPLQAGLWGGTSAAAERAQKRDAYFAEIKKAADAGESDKVAGMLHKMFDYAGEPGAAETAAYVMDAQERAGLKPAMNTASYLLNAGRHDAFGKAVTAKAFPLLEKADKADAGLMATSAMLSGLIASGNVEAERGLAAWRAAVGALEKLSGFDFAFAAASNAVLGFGRGNPAFTAEGLKTWERLVEAQARADRDAARREILRVHGNYDSFGEAAKPFKALAVAVLRRVLGEEVPPPPVPKPLDIVAHLKRVFAEQQPLESLAFSIQDAAVRFPKELRAALRQTIEERLAEAPRLQRHLTALDEDGDGLVSLGESRRALRAMGFGVVKSAVIAAGSQLALVATTGRAGWFSFRVDGGPKGLHRTVHTGAMDPEQALEKKLDEFMAEDLDKDGFLTMDDVSRLIDKRAAASDKNRLAVALIKAANKAEFSALFQLRPRMSRDDLRDFYTGSLFFSLLDPLSLARRLINLRPKP